MLRDGERLVRLVERRRRVEQREALAGSRRAAGLHVGEHGKQSSAGEQRERHRATSRGIWRASAASSDPSAQRTRPLTLKIYGVDGHLADPRRLTPTSALRHEAHGEASRGKPIEMRDGQLATVDAALAMVASLPDARS